MKVVQLGSKRPEVYLVQAAINNGSLDISLIHNEIRVDGNCGTETKKYITEMQERLDFDPDDIDGKWGNGTWTVYLANYPTFRMSPLTWIQSIIALFENSSTKDGYGFAENDIGDGAGANYGILQHNKLGSMVTLLKMAGEYKLLTVYNSTNKNIVNKDIKYWMNSPNGRYYQNKYFQEKIIQPAAAELGRICTVEPTPLSLGLFCDSMTQNGTQFSNRKPFFAKEQSGIDRELIDGKNWDEKFPELPFEKCKEIWKQDFAEFKDLPEKEAIKKTNIKIINHMCSLLDTQERKLELIAEYRARTSSYKYWKDVLSRRLLWATGKSVVHGSKYDLEADFFYSHVGEL